MKKVLFLAFCLVAAMSLPAQSLKSVLLQQLKSTHDKENWFVPISVALDGVTPEQAVWISGNGNHSIGQLANHLLFWNQHQLAEFRGEKVPPYNGNNEETFTAFTKDQWKQTVKKLNDVLTQLEQLIEKADDASLNSWAETVANISAHNAYHTGQIIYIRKLQGSWKPEKGGK